MIQVVNYNYYISEVQTSALLDKMSQSFNNHNKEESSNNTTLEEIDLQTSEIPKSESRVGDNEENIKITEVQTSENPTLRVRHIAAVKTSEFLTSALLESRSLVGRKPTLKKLMNMHMNVKMSDFIYLTKMLQEEKSNHKTDFGGVYR